jgi:hypothetical protein
MELDEMVSKDAESQHGVFTLAKRESTVPPRHP